MILDQKGIQAIEEAVQKVLSEFDLGEIKANEDQTNTFRVVASDETIDRDGETLIAKGCDFSHFLKNPVMFIDHSSWSVGNITAKATDIYVENNQVIIEGVFTDKTEAGRIANALYNDGFLKAVSVGFFIKKRNDKDSKIIEKWEIYECSFVSIPCNPNAISLDAKMYQKGLDIGLIKQEVVKDEIKYATIEDMLRVEYKLDKVLSLLDGKSAEEQKKLQDFEEKEFLQDLTRMLTERLREKKKPV